MQHMYIIIIITEVHALKRTGNYLMFIYNCNVHKKAEAERANENISLNIPLWENCCKKSVNVPGIHIILYYALYQSASIK
jgi:hypothetical protein